ncbi:hypothetical protein Hanom_Chr05g00458031 [Helianthus anomalus]
MFLPYKYECFDYFFYYSTNGFDIEKAKNTKIQTCIQKICAEMGRNTRIFITSLE